MIYKMKLTDSSDSMTFDLLEVPIVDKDIEGAVDNVTLDGNQYTDYLWLKKQYIQKWAILCDTEYTQLRGFYTRQFENATIPTYRLYYGTDSTLDKTVSGEYITTTVSGIEEAPIADISLLGNTTQDGTPTPDAPVSISTVTGENTVTISDGTDTQEYEVNLGKNLLDSTATLQGTWNVASNTTTCTHFMPIITGETYTISNQDTDTWRFSAGLTTSSTNSPAGTGSQISAWQTGDSYTITAESNGYLWVQLRKNANTAITPSDIPDDVFMIERGSSASTFASYFTPIELCKIDDYQDYIFKNTSDSSYYDDTLTEDAWYIHKEVGKVVYDGSSDESIGVTAYSPNYRFQVVNQELKDNPPLYSGTTTPQGFSNNFVWSWVNTIANVSSATDYSFCPHSTPTIFFTMLGEAGITTTTDFKTWLASNPTTVYYALATATDTEITDEALLEDLEALETIELFLGVNNITTETENEQPTLNIKYTEIYGRETDVVSTTAVRLTLTDDGVINNCGCRQNVQLTMRETVS